MAISESYVLLFLATVSSFFRGLVILIVTNLVWKKKSESRGPKKTQAYENVEHVFETWYIA